MATARKPKAAAVAPPAPPSRRVHVLDASAMAQNRGQWRQTHNPLRGLNSAVLTGYIEESERGATASLQHLIYWIERENAVLVALGERFRAALSELDWSIKIPEHVPPEQRPMAEQQQQKLTEFYHGLRGLRKSIEELGMARFRGVSFLEMAMVRGVPCLDPVPPVYFCRDGFGPWQYNRAASAGAVNGESLELSRWVIREAEVPISRIAARLHVIRSMCLADWQGYIETFGVPAIFAVMPEGVSPADRLEFQDIMERIVSDARGALPAGTKLETVTANNGAGGSPFLELMDWCDRQLVLAGTGGLLTMLAEAGSGTLAGGAHMQAFELLARREAVMVSECLQDQMDQLLLERWSPCCRQRRHPSRRPCPLRLRCCRRRPRYRARRCLALGRRHSRCRQHHPCRRSLRRRFCNPTRARRRRHGRPRAACSCSRLGSASTSAPRTGCGWRPRMLPTSPAPSRFSKASSTVK